MMILLLKRRNFFTDETEYGAVLACNRYRGLEKPRCDLKERGIFYWNLMESSDQGKIGPKIAVFLKMVGRPWQREAELPAAVLETL